MAARKPLVIGSVGLKAELDASDALDGVTAYVEKSTTPTSTDYRRPLILGDRWRNTTNGIVYTYSDTGVWLYDTASSLSRYVPARLRSGASSPIPLNTDGTVPAKLRNGTVSNIPTTA